MHLHLVLRQGDFNLLHVGCRQLQLLWVNVRISCSGEAHLSVLHRMPTTGSVPCANTDGMVPVEVLMYEPESLRFSKVADFCALFNSFVTVS